MGDIVRFAFNKGEKAEDLEADMGLAIFAAECVYGKPRVRMEASYLVAQDGRSCVLQVGGESGEAAARIFSGLAAVRFGEQGFKVQREAAPDGRAGAVNRAALHEFA